MLKHKFFVVVLAISVLMLLHVGVIYFDLYYCARLVELQVDEVGAANVDLSNTECHTVEETLQRAVSEYLKVFLALLGGGAAVEAIRRRNGNE